MNKEQLEKNVEAAKKREEAATKRALAVNQKERAAGHLQQAEKPIFPDQAMVCIDKAARLEAFAEQNLATAARLEAEAAMLEATDDKK